MNTLINFNSPFIKTIQEKKLIGMSMNMNLADNKTPLLWRTFMPRRKEISNTISSELISMQVYNPTQDFKNFTLLTYFDKWATVEVSEYNSIPEGMETFTLPSGLYAVFQYKGSVSEAATAFRYIFETWRPASEYELDARPHFEVLGEKYSNTSPDSEEEIWIPIKASSR